MHKTNQTPPTPPFLRGTPLDCRSQFNSCSFLGLLIQLRAQMLALLGIVAHIRVVHRAKNIACFGLNQRPRKGPRGAPFRKERMHCRVFLCLGPSDFVRSKNIPWGFDKIGLSADLRQTPYDTRKLQHGARDGQPTPFVRSRCACPRR